MKLKVEWMKIIISSKSCIDFAQCDLAAVECGVGAKWQHLEKNSQNKVKSMCMQDVLKKGKKVKKVFWINA